MEYVIPLDSPERRDRLISRLQGVTLDKTWEVLIRPFKSSRSAAQNRLMWKWYGELAGHTGHDVDELHEYFKRKFLGTEIREVLNEKTEVPKSTTKLKVMEMTDYLQRLEAWAYNFGCPLSMPGDYDKAMGKK